MGRKKEETADILPEHLHRHLDVFCHLDEYLRRLTTREGTATLTDTREALVDFIRFNQIICAEDILPEHVGHYENRSREAHHARINRVAQFLKYLRAKGFVLFTENTRTIDDE